MESENKKDQDISFDKDLSVHDRTMNDFNPGKDKNWYELRLAGKVPDRRGYHSHFALENK